MGPACFVSWLLNILVTSEENVRDKSVEEFYVLPHCDRDSV